jgi:hypothetical protein
MSEQHISGTQFQPCVMVRRLEENLNADESPGVSGWGSNRGTNELDCVPPRLAQLTHALGTERTA